jgi:rubrerythrin
MDLKKFNEIIDFAIAREKEAINFYQGLQKEVKFDAQKDLLKSFEDMEQGHVDILESIRNMKFENIKVPEVDDLKIANYVVEIEPSPDMSYQDIIIMAMKREEAANKLYTAMAEKVGNAEIKKLFEKLASEEAKHKLHFEKIYDKEVLTDN